MSGGRAALGLRPYFAASSASGSSGQLRPASAVLGLRRPPRGRRPARRARSGCPAWPALPCPLTRPRPPSREPAHAAEPRASRSSALTGPRAAAEPGGRAGPVSCIGQLSPAECTILVVVRYNYCVDAWTPTRNSARLLVQLLRVVTPAVSDTPAPRMPGFAPQPSVSASEGRALVELLAARGIAQGEARPPARPGEEHREPAWPAAWSRRAGSGAAGTRATALCPALPHARRLGGSRPGCWQAWQSRQARIIASLTDAERAGLAIGLGGLLRGLVAEGILGDTGTVPGPGELEPPASAASPEPPRRRPRPELSAHARPAQDAGLPRAGGIQG